MAQRASVATVSPRQSYNFDRDWRMAVADNAGFATPAFDDSAWKPVSLPHAFNEDQAFAIDGHDHAEGIIWYRKHFTLPADAPKGEALLEFQGVRQAAEVWVNGQKLGFSENGVMAFGVDITAALKPGDNVVAVRVDNHWDYRERATNTKFQWEDKNFYANFGGINKSVRLHLTGPVYQTLPLYSSLGTSGSYIWADAYDVSHGAATVHAEAQVRNASAKPMDVRYSVLVRDLQGRQVARFEGERGTLAAGATVTLHAQQRLSGLHFWSWGYGYLYTVTGILSDAGGKVIDAIDTRTGFRETRFDHGEVRLNGRVLQLKGYAQRSTNEWAAVGPDVPPWVSDLSNGMITGSNGNLVRWMHVTPAKQDIESADRLGLIEAMPAGDSEGDPTGRRWDQRVEVMRDAIIYNRNNPSILFYESGNHGITDAHMAQMRALKARWDPHGGRAIGAREMLGSDPANNGAEYGGEMLYINKSAGKPLWAMEYSRDEAARAYQDDWTPPFHKDAPDYNRNVESMAVEDVRRWWDYYQQRPGGGDRVSAGGVKIGFTDSNSHFRGDNNYRRSGVVDAVRLPKDPWFVHQAMWDGWVESGGHHLHILGHWTYPESTVKPVYVVANAERVELFLNGLSLGQGQRDSGFLFTFPDVHFRPGTLKAVATFADGTTTQENLTTAGAPVAIRLTPRTGPRGFVADGTDLALVDVEVVDGKGQRVPTAFNPVDFTLTGAAQWRGGIAQGDSSGRPRPTQAVMAPTYAGTTSFAGTARGEDNYILARHLPVELGVNRVLVRSTTQAGSVHLEASSPGLKSASIDLKTVAAPVKGGLSTQFAEDAQPSDLSRGPTPPGDSVVPRFVTLHPVAITAGSNQTNAAKSHDDNEATTWSSDGKPDTAWIEYRFAKPQSVAELSLRLTGWRIRSYPIQVTLDGKVIYEGETPKSLGYVSLPMGKGAAGTRLRIALTGPTADRDAFGKIVEVKNDKVAASVGADAVPAGWHLSIVEADLLGPVAK
ncbi:sugar-binding domain-containing protein [Novosphingobium sp. 9]|uniref:sugar-binding domain-containing protein n=1 Tax=Novosphingobium sp. 9 TaxID=2025349 RepID=UPI0021B65718|nr:sugar-binding domain-containing protein [Novosphingobium sp. 9]